MRLPLNGWCCQSQLGCQRCLEGTLKIIQPAGLEAAPCGWTTCPQNAWGDMGHPVPAWLFESWDIFMVLQGRGRLGSVFGKVIASRAIPFAWWWKGLVLGGQTLASSVCPSSWLNHPCCQVQASLWVCARSDMEAAGWTGPCTARSVAPWLGVTVNDPFVPFNPSPSSHQRIYILRWPRTRV